MTYLFDLTGPEDIEIKVYRNLIALKPGDSIPVSDLARKDPTKLIEIVKMCIDAYCPVDFNSDYTTIRRLNYPITKNEINYETTEEV